MSLVIVYDVEAKRTELRSLPLGTLVPGVLTSDGQSVWKNGDEYLYGKLMVDPGTLMYFSRIHKDKVTNVQDLKMANVLDVMQCLDEVTKRPPTDRLDELELSLKREIQKNRNNCANHKRSMEKLRADLRHGTKKYKVDEKMAIISEARCENIYSTLVTGVLKELRSAKNDADKAIKKHTPTTTWHFYCNVTSSWIQSSSAEARQACDQVNSGQANEVEFKMNGVSYRIYRQNGQIVQMNLSTKFTRLLELKSLSHCDEKIAYRSILCRDAFVAKFDNDTICAWRKELASYIDSLPVNTSYSATQASKISSAMQLYECVRELVLMIAELSDCKDKANPDRCTLLIKPYMLLSVLHKFTECKDVHVRPVIHGSNNENIEKIEKSGYGMKSVYSKSNCHMGMANYVSPVYSLPSAHYSPGGKTMLLLLFSHTNTVSSNPSIVVYNLTETQVDEQGRVFKNAFAVRQDDHLLPIAIIQAS